MKRALGVFKSSKNITAISVAVFIVTVLLLASSTYYINVCIGNEEQANADYSVCKQMGTDLADASDYLTTEVRLFAVTHSIEHFYNYWKEINDTKTRDNVITQFEERDAPDNETAYLIGHLESVKRMVENDYDCSDVIIQLSAVRSALNNAGKIIIKNHIDHCIVEAVKEGDNETIEKLNDAIDRFIK